MVSAIRLPSGISHASTSGEGSPSFINITVQFRYGDSLPPAKHSQLNIYNGYVWGQSPRRLGPKIKTDILRYFFPSMGDPTPPSRFVTGVMELPPSSRCVSRSASTLADMTSSRPTSPVPPSCGPPGRRSPILWASTLSNALGSDM